MGYYSDVYIKATHDLLPQLYPLILEFYDVKWYTDDDYVSCHFNCKFYAGYSWVDALVRLLEANPDNCCAIVIGEDSACNEINTPSDFDMYTYTKVDGFDGTHFDPTSILKTTAPEVLL